MSAIKVSDYIAQFLVDNEIKDVFLISYNEFDLNEVVMNGLTTISTDFKQMGRTAAAMILEKRSWKTHCDFKMTRRNTF